MIGRSRETAVGSLSGAQLALLRLEVRLPYPRHLRRRLRTAMPNAPALTSEVPLNLPVRATTAPSSSQRASLRHLRPTRAGSSPNVTVTLPSITPPAVLLTASSKSPAGCGFDRAPRRATASHNPSQR